MPEQVDDHVRVMYHVYKNVQIPHTTQISSMGIKDLNMKSQPIQFFKQNKGDIFMTLRWENIDTNSANLKRLI